MIAPRWRKVLRDIGEAPVRSSLAVVAMAAGVFGLGTILTSYSILTRELEKTFADTRPASAILIVDNADDAVVASVRAVPGVLDAEARPIVRARVRVGKDEWAPLVLFVVPDFRDLRIDRFSRTEGAGPPGDDEVALERTALSVARAAIGDRITMRTADGVERPMRVAGTVHAAGLAPAWMDHVVSGFVTRRLASHIDAQAMSNQVRIIVKGNRLDERHIRDVADRVRKSLEAEGHKVTPVDVPAPGRHPHADQMDTFLFLLGAFGALTLVLSAVLVANMIHALLTEQVRQVGVMKAIGATTRQVVALYLGQVAILAVLSLCIGMPLAFSAGRGYGQFTASILNATISTAAVPLWVIATQIAVGIALPLLVALLPVYRASRITIHQAFSNDISGRAFGTRPFDRWLARLRLLPRPLMLSLRTTFHRRGRLVLAVSTLAVGGAAFISALNVSAEWTRIIAEDAVARRYDVYAVFSRPYPIAQIAAAVDKLSNITHAEYWSESAAIVAGPNGRETRIALVGLDPNTPLLRLPLLEGRWLNASDSDAVVINQNLLADAPWLHAGNRIALRVNGRPVSWNVVGVVKEMGAHQAVYANSADALRATGQAGDTARSVRVVTRAHDAKSQLAASRELERALQRDGIGVLLMQSLADGRKAFEDHLVIIKSALIFAAALVVLVGGLGLTSTLTLNVIERTRELGILGAIGATPRALSRYIVFEGVLMGLLSWCIAIVLAVPVTYFIGTVAGRMFHKTGLDFLMSPQAVITWFALVIILATLSSFYPAWRATRLSVREALAYA